MMLITDIVALLLGVSAGVLLALEVETVATGLLFLAAAAVFFGGRAAQRRRQR